MPQNVDLSAVYSPPYSAFTHDGARHRRPIRARRSWPIRRGSKIHSKKRFPEVNAVLARHGSEHQSSARSRAKSLIEKQDSVWALGKSVIALANPLASTPRKSFRGVKYLQGPPNSGSAFPIRFICTKEDPGYHSVRHFRHGKLWPIAKRPSSVGQGTSKYVDVGIPSVASIGLKLWDPRWTLLGSEGFFCGEFYFTKLHAENQIDESLRE
ncbi:hypothetical protein DFH06DRAFT_1341096 [Mycena polygramma]|nr:hypothetical protein DFH06DRAFT_1341096 [Mycena polygramma]